MFSFKGAKAKLREKTTRKWLLLGLAALVAVQIYYVQEMLAALLLFSVAFALVGAVLLILFTLDRASQWALGWTEVRAVGAVRVARRGWVALEEVSKKPLHRLRSQTAR
jgi:hypothetical protein